jgi:fatty acid desaturase
MKPTLTFKNVDISIPRHLNLVIIALATGTSLSMLYLATHAQSWGLILAAAVVFSFSNNTCFALLHDAVHGVLHPNKKVNDALGIYLSAFFPTGLTYQRSMHLAHHRVNRTDDEMYESYYPRDNRIIKNIQLYGMLTGFFWPLAVLSWVSFLCLPNAIRYVFVKNGANKRIKHLGANHYMKAILENRNQRRMKLELLYSAAFQIALFLAFGANALPWFLCYYVFSINWGSLQYADHAYSKRDIRYGAWNLKINPYVQYVFLNYHAHLAHHSYPQVPWIHLPKFVDPAAESPGFAEIYLKLWKGVVPTTAASPLAADRELESLIANGLEAEVTP